MAKLITNYEAKKSKITNVDNNVTKFTITGVHPSLVNALRRLCLSAIPVVGFDDTYHDDTNENKINIHKNISSLHNEFIAHRISLIPICMYKSERIKIIANYDERLSVINYNFKFPDSLPIFSLNIKNDLDTRITYKINNTDNNIDVLSKYIKLKNESDVDEIHKFIIPDYETGDYILLHRLKPNTGSDDVQETEELSIDMELTIGTGYENARYCPVGTITYEFDKDAQSVIDEKFSMYIENLKKQREIEGLPPFKDTDITQYRNSYNLLDAERIYAKNEFGDPERTNFCVESVGNLESNQIVYDALTIIELKSIILMNMFIWDEKSNTFKVNQNRIKMNINETNGFVEVQIKNEDHTIGNLISSYLKRLFIVDKILGEQCTFATYKMPHPLEEAILIIVGIDNTKSFSKLFSQYALPLATEPMDIAINLIILSINAYLSKVAILKKNWSEITSIHNTSFDIINNTYLTDIKYDVRTRFGSLHF
jgi:DNA-directed RNA polymerase subunit L/DNA-directed RNA polymerase alpha subunit